MINVSRETSESVLELDALDMRYGSTLALNRLSFSVSRGEMFGLLGPNGAGKTTFVRVMNGLLPYSAGRVSVLGMDPALQGDAIRARTGVLTETPSLYERLTGRQNLEFSGRMWSLAPDLLAGRVDELLDFFDLSARADDLAGAYSKGMKQRLALARALLPHPDLLFLDEPTSGLDPEATRQVNDLLERIRTERGQTVILCTHHLYEAQALCDRVAVLNRGEVLALGAPVDLARELFPQPRVRVGFENVPDPATLAAWLTRAGAVDYQPAESGDVDLSLRSGASLPDLISSLVEQGARLNRVEPLAVSLEEVYFALQERGNGKSQ